MNRKIIPLLGLAALAYVWYLTRQQRALMVGNPVSNTVAGKKIACPTGYAYTVDNYGRGSCVPFNSPGWQDNGNMEVVQKGENMVYDQNGNLVPLDSMFADKPNFVSFSPMTGK